MRKLDGTYGTVDALKVERNPQRMYNLTVYTAHTFFVGDGRWLVHNAGGNPFCGLTSRQINQRFIGPSQQKLLVQFFGRNIAGARYRASNFRIPGGLSRRALTAYIEIARRQIARGTDVENQRLRIQLARRAMREMP